MNHNRIDIVRADAPELAHFGSHPTGVRTVEFTDPYRPDILSIPEGGVTPRYDRTLTVEIWYPARLWEGQTPGTQYPTTTRNRDIRAILTGSATRDADPLRETAPYPLVILSHGYPGNRYLLSHLGENLASKGYVVVSIDHKDSTYEDQGSFGSTLFNRPLDQRFVLQKLADAAGDRNSFLYHLVDADSTAIVGYSMGGYGLLNNLGAGFSDDVVNHPIAPPHGLLAQHATSNPGFRTSLDPRIKAGVAIAPWGMENGFWKDEDLLGINRPTLYVAGSLDAIAGYENGTRAIFDGARNSDRYLLTFINAGHNAGAPIPLPVEFLNRADQAGSGHYTDPVWDTVRMNNIMDHFITVFLDFHLKGEHDRMAYLNLVPNSMDGVWDVSKDGEPTGSHTYWKGFPRRNAVGLRLEHKSTGE